jgi:DNA-binding transcriptional MerR regulator
VARRSRERPHAERRAKRAGLSPHQVRIYLDMGLLRPSATTAGGYRLFDERCVERLKLIKACRDAQINLAEIAEFVRGMGMAATSNSASAWSFARAGSGVSLPRRLPDQCRLLPSVQWRFVPAEPRDRGTCAQSECALGRDRERRRVLTLLRIEMRPLVQVCDGSQECFLLIDAMSSGAQVTWTGQISVDSQLPLCA